MEQLIFDRIRDDVLRFDERMHHMPIGIVLPEDEKLKMLSELYPNDRSELIEAQAASMDRLLGIPLMKGDTYSLVDVDPRERK